MLFRSKGLRARVRATTWERLASTPLPAIAILKDGGFVFLAKADGQRVLFQQPGAERPTLMDAAQFAGVWSGSLVLMARRSALQPLSSRFDISWFLSAIQKYRRMFAEVLVASFFLQVFALVSPLIFQVVIDKVLVHQSMSTLDVLIVGLLAIAVFETILSILRTYVFSHTTNRIDVELGARLFRHLLSLPLTYFRTRRAGDSVARVRELETIRNFLTSSALTLIIDLVFTFVFIGIMFMYSGVLTWIVIASLPLYASRPFIPGFIDFTHVANSGVAYGFLQNVTFPVKTALLALVSTAAMLTVAAYAASLSRSEEHTSELQSH